MAGMTANHHRRGAPPPARATTTRQTPMMISVLPMWDQSAVTESQVRSRVSCSDRFRALSDRFHPISGPVSSRPIAAMANHSRMPGASAPRRMPRMAVPRAGPVRRSRSGVWATPLVDLLSWPLRWADGHLGYRNSNGPGQDLAVESR
jgi:hypothetical protein